MSKFIKRTCIFSGLFVCMVSAGLLTAQPNDWQPRGIGGGGALFSPSISPHNTEEIFIACDMTNLFYTANAGKRWEVIPFSEIRSYPETHVQFTSDPNILYAVHFDFIADLTVAVKSMDAGKTWLSLANDPTSGEAYYLFADPNRTDRLIISNYDQIFFSNDGGRSFSTIYSNDENDGAYLAGAFWDGANIFIAVPRGILVSSNNGASFELNAFQGIPGNEGIVSFSAAKQSAAIRFYCVTLELDDIYPTVTGAEHEGFQNVYVLEYSGPRTWIAGTNGLGLDDHPFFVATSPANIDIAYLGGGNSATFYPIVYKTEDGGKNWREVFRTENNENIATGWSGYRGDEDWWYGEYVLGLAVAPSNPDIAVITDLGFAHITADGGATWRQMYVDESTQNAASAATPRGRSYRSVGLENTTVWGLTWLDRNSIFASFSDVTAMRSEDGGVTWSRNFSNMDENSVYHTIVLPATGTLYAATSTVHDLYQSTYLKDSAIDDDRGAILFSSDGGENWQTLHDFEHPVFWLAVDPNDSQTLYASVVHSSEGGIYRTTNLQDGASSSWTRLAVPPRTQGHPFNIHVLADGTLVCTYSGRRDNSGAFTESSGVFMSADGGNTWLDRSDPGMHYWCKDLVVDPHDSRQNTWYVAVFSGWGGAPNGLGGIYKTTNRGANWTKINDLDRVESCSIHPENADIMYVGTEADGLWYSDNLTDASANFTLITSYPFQHPVRIFFDPFDSNNIWVTSFGNGLRVGTDIASSVDGRQSEAPEDFRLSIHPNPAIDHVNIQFVLTTPQEVELKIHNILGQEISLFHKRRYFSRGTHAESIDLSGLPPGVYYIQIKTAQNRVVKKISLLK